MNRFSTTLLIGAALLINAWLGSKGAISSDMMATLQIVLPALWVIAWARGGRCCRPQRELGE